MQGTRWFTLFGSGVLIASCVVLSPLDEVNPRLTDGGAGGDGSSQHCQTNAECSAGNADEPFRCFEGECISLKSPECSVVYDGKEGRDHADPNPVYLGAFANYGNSAGVGSDFFNYQFALEELSGPNIRGVPGPNITYRPVVLVVCDNADTRSDRREVVKRGFEHLVDRVHVPGILTALREEDLLEHFGTFGRGKGTFFLSPFGANQILADAPDDGLMWHMLGLPSQLAPTYVALVKRLEQRVKAQRTGVTAIKVAVVQSRLGFDTELADFVLRDLEFNGKSASANQLDGNFQLHRLEAETDLAGVAGAIKLFQPHIVLSLAGEPFTDTILPVIEPDLGGDGTYFVLSPVNLGSMEQDIKPVIWRSIDPLPKTPKRYLAINVAGAADKGLYNKYFEDLRLAFRNSRPGTENYYDAMYFLVYALHAGNPTGNASGADMASGIKRLIAPGPTTHAVGGLHVSSVYAALLAATNRIALNGTLGPPLFDETSGVRVSSGSVMCFEFTPDTEFKVTEASDVLRLDDKGELVFSSGYNVGNAPCLDDEPDM